MPRHRPLGNKLWYIWISKTFLSHFGFSPFLTYPCANSSWYSSSSQFWSPPSSSFTSSSSSSESIPCESESEKEVQKVSNKNGSGKKYYDGRWHKKIAAACIMQTMQFTGQKLLQMCTLYIGISKWKWKFMRGKVKVYDKKRSWKEVLWCEMAAERLLAFARSCIKSENCQIFWQNISIGSHCIARCIGSMPSSHFFPVLLAHHLLKRSKKKLTNCHCHTFS